MLYGTYPVMLDDKNRLRIPAKLKKMLEGEEQLSIGVKQDRKALVIYPKSTVETISSKIREQVLSVEKRQALLMRFFSMMYDIEEDSQGRFTVNPYLKEVINLGKDVSFVGAGDRIELWNTDEFKAAREADEQRRRMAAEKRAQNIADDDDVDLSGLGL